MHIHYTQVNAFSLEQATDLCAMINAAFFERPQAFEDRAKENATQNSAFSPINSAFHIFLLFSSFSEHLRHRMVD